MSFESRFLAKEGDNVEILGWKYTVAKPHLIVGINLNEGKLKIRTIKNGQPVVRDYSYKELTESELVKKKAIKEADA